MSIIRRSTSGLPATSPFVTIWDVLSGNQQVSTKLRTNTDDLTSEINTLIAQVSAAGGGSIEFPSGTYFAEGIVPAPGVELRGTYQFSSSPSSINSFMSTLSSTLGATPLINQASGNLVNFAISGMLLSGTGATGTAGACYFSNASSVHFKGVSFNWFPSYLVRQDAGTVLSLTDVFGQNMFLSPTVYSAPIGAISVGGSDAIIDKISIAGPNTFLSSGFESGLLLDATSSTCLVRSARTWAMETGTRIQGSIHRISNLRVIQNQGTGCSIEGSNNLFSNCFAQSNSASTSNSYDGFYVPGNYGDNLFSNCLSNGASQQRYGFNDGSQLASGRNVYAATCSAYGNVSGSFNLQASTGASRTAPTGNGLSFPAGDLTPSVDNYGSFNVGGDDAYTNFTNGFQGQTITISTGGYSGASLVFGTNIKTTTGATIVMAAYRIYSLKLFGSTWIQLF